MILNGAVESLQDLLTLSSPEVRQEDNLLEVEFEMRSRARATTDWYFTTNVTAPVSEGEKEQCMNPETDAVLSIARHWQAVTVGKKVAGDSAAELRSHCDRSEAEDCEHRASDDSRTPNRS